MDVQGIKNLATSQNLTRVGLAAIVGAAGLGIQQWLTGGMAAVRWDVIIPTIFSAVIAVLAKGQASTGGTMAQTPEAEVRLAAAAPPAPAAAPKGFARLELLALLAFLALAGLACATLKGATTSTTVTTKDGKSYTLTVGDAGGCVVGAGWYAIPKTPFECSKVCVDVNPGAVTPGARCRLTGRPETEFDVQVPVPTGG
jgi:hypothetical protein